MLEPVFWAQLWAPAPDEVPCLPYAPKESRKQVSPRVGPPSQECVKLKQDYQGVDSCLSGGYTGSRYIIIPLSHRLETFHNKKIFSMTSVITFNAWAFRILSFLSSGCIYSSSDNEEIFFRKVAECAAI